MGKFLRKLNKQGVWKKDILSQDPDKILETLPADVFSKCMNTEGNALSIWEVEGDKWSDFEDIVAAIVCGSDGPSATDFVILDEDCLSRFARDDKDGTLDAAGELNNKHANLIELTHSKVGVLAQYIGLILANDNVYDIQKKPRPADWKFKRFKESELIAIMKRAVGKGCINQDLLKERWKKRLQ
ncbi:MAG: hypothetical protein E6736_13485 [Leclercia adecarboxylata]|nr:hypothetical protein [Leclercia adecarboxylata]